MAFKFGHHSEAPYLNIQKFPLILTIFFIDKSSIFEGGVFVDVSFTTVERNMNRMDQLDDEKEREIQNLLNDEFCNLDIGAQAQGETCTVQNLEFRVKKD